jgi:tetratricopeptide (TPR) repeat protein
VATDLLYQQVIPLQCADMRAAEAARDVPFWCAPRWATRFVRVADEWFRSGAWDEAARADFEVRLARARRNNRQQYLRVKGLALRAAEHTEGARELLERAAAFPDGYRFQTVAAWETLADMAIERGDRGTAEELLRRILTEQGGASGSIGDVEITLAELLLDTGQPEARAESIALLTAWIERDRLKFDNQLFRWHLNLIRVADATGDQATVRRAAKTALELAERGPQLPRHGDVGLVRTDDSTLRRLRRLAT